MSYSIEPADYDSVKDLFALIRESDAREVMASAGQTPEEAITLSMALSLDSWVLLENGTPVCVFGVAPVTGKRGVGSPWMMASHRFAASKAPPHIRRRITRVILAQSKKYIHKMLDQFYLLENYVDVRNESSIRWLKWCGFKLDPPVPYGVENLPFHPFYMEKPDV